MTKCCLADYLAAILWVISLFYKALLNRERTLSLKEIMEHYFDHLGLSQGEGLGK